MTTTYKVTLNVTTKSDPREMVDYIQRKIKDVIPVLSLEYRLIEDRPTTVEHHGGNP